MRTVAALSAVLIGLALLSAPARAEDIVRKVQDSTAPAVPSAQDDGAAGAPASTLPVPTPVQNTFFADAF